MQDRNATGSGEQAARARWGILGGSFDPVHNGHLHLAVSAMNELSLAQVRFIPAAAPPHKLGRHLAPAEDRLNMLRLALAGAQSFLIDEIEIARGGVSFTWETLETLSRSHPEAELFFLAGSDSISEFATWRRIDLIAGLATFVVLKRDGSGVEAPPELVLALKGTPLRTAVLDADPLSVSSTEIRQAVARGACLKGLVPPPVEDYIREKGLYSPGKLPGAGRGECIR